MRFIHFGCWNNINGNNLEENMDSIQHFLQLPSSKRNPIEFFSIAGDNYYPEKEEKGKGKGEKSKKTIVEDDLRNGFDLLPNNDKNKFVILGNHDLETNMKFISSSGKETYDNSCKILELEKEITDGREDTFLNLFKFLFDKKTKTLIVFLDTTMYIENKDFEKYQTCYRKLPIPGRSKKTSNYQDTLIEFQNNAIIEYISQRGTINKLVLIGHHPLIYLKKKLKNKEETIKAKQDIPHIMGLLSRIFEICPTSDFFYLCADLHLYQEGEVTFKDKVIKQYIVGTGGTKLDDEIPEDYNDTDHKKDDMSYKHIQSIHDHGFLECNFPTKALPTFIFHSKSFSTPPSRKPRSVPRSLSPSKKNVTSISSNRSVSPSKGGKHNKTQKTYTRRNKKN
tara:strand:- start:972 stop:2153 length:1182 start_codon:yes stop_codon:yes gene_type:complete